MKQIFNNLKENYKNLFNSYRTILTSLGILIVVVSFFFLQQEKPTSLNGMLRTGEKYVNEGKLSYALEHYNRTVRSYPRSYEAHMRLGNLFLQVKELQKAKIEFYRAIKLKSTRKYDAYFSLANAYVSEDNFKFAQEILYPISSIANTSIQERMGDFYHTWGDRMYGLDDFEAIRKYREAYNYYHTINSNKTREAKKTVEASYGKVADDLIAKGKIVDAIKILEISLEFSNNALAHYKLARIYEKLDEERALNEYDIAFKLKDSRNFDRGGYVRLLIKKGDVFKTRGDEIQANGYYLKARKLNSIINASYLVDKHIILSIVSAKYNEDIDRDIIIPGVSFKIMNVSKQKINHLKAKIVFTDKGAFHSQDEVVLAEPNNPMESDAVTEVVSIFSPRPIFQIIADHSIKAQVYISQREPDDWKLYRNIYYDRVKSFGISLKEDED